jgi:hypothetical protein
MNRKEQLQLRWSFERCPVCDSCGSCGGQCAGIQPRNRNRVFFSVSVCAVCVCVFPAAAIRAPRRTALLGTCVLAEAHKGQGTSSRRTSLASYVTRQSSDTHVTRDSVRASTLERV